MEPKQLVGVVVSASALQTTVIRVTRLVRHPVYQKVVRRSKKFKVHDPGKIAQVGDEVRIESTRPISKEKRWRLIEVLRKNPSAQGDIETVSQGASRPRVSP